MSGPPTIATAMMAPRMPMYLPRSSGLTISASTICPSAPSPPAPTPWNTRQTISQVGSGAKPAAADERMKTISAICSSAFLLVRSASLPQIGVTIALASMVAVTTQVNAACVPPMSAMMIGIEVPTTFIASIETKFARNRPESARFFARPVRRTDCEPDAAV